MLFHALASGIAMVVVITSHIEDTDIPLPKVRTHRRLTGEVISPLVYTNELVNLDHWDHMFITNCCKGLTLHRFDEPPASVLDLGCGRGLWAIEAAKRWQNSEIVGFDTEHIQPPLNLLDKKLARRLGWAYGNVLDGLPFLPGQFEFVRMARMGLHIPEDEWGYVLAEITRVLSPNGVLEIIEEDLIFPSQPSLYPSITFASRRSSGTSSPRSSNTAVSNQTPLTRSDPSITGTALLSGSSLSSLSLVMRGADLKCQPPPDPRDHTRLRRAWEEMLSASFLTPDLVSVLPFHLGAWFREILTHTPLEVPIPPRLSRKRSAQPTTGGTDLIDPDVLFDLRPLSSTMLAESDDDSMYSPDQKSSHRVVSSWAPMHLARSVRTITACKESIWRAYQRLYGQDSSIPSLVRSAGGKYLKNHLHEARSTTNPLRDYFERDWLNWETDMADRVSVRESIRSELSWKEPFGKATDSRARFKASSLYDETEYEEKRELCRRLRGFVCFKGDMAATNRGSR